MSKNLNDLFGKKPAPIKMDYAEMELRVVAQSVELELKVVESEPISPLLARQVPSSYKGTVTGRINVPGPELQQLQPPNRVDGARRDRLAADIRQAVKRLDVRQGKKELLEQQRDDSVMKRLEAQQQLDTFDKVQILLQKTSDYARQQAKSRIEEIVTSALSVVFGKEYSFTVDLQVRSNRPEADYYLTSEGVTTQLKPPDYDRGGGVADVVSLALRLAVGELEGIAGPLFLDEVGKHVSAEFAPNVAYFLKEYSSKFGRQIVLITHNEALAAVSDHSLAVTQKSGVSKVSVV
ncbi:MULTISPECIES: hypothetical protein [Pelosinus]|uniref:Chromosome segregation ATPase n=1 Tax=Pelosinus fermentans B4 TaxID=1149862 RepID=I8RJ33_9FIRM|nr:MULTISPECIES: hypothetical protein [Pelosinus]EIW19958.1 hypothetical protein FB4_0209 [Pelosinus fermentans B4]EIW21185.1 hypothetical protein FA11_0912 [Pelosinus fermentans A11]